MNDPLSSSRKNGEESPSAYASAESSPSNSMATSLSMHSLPASASSNVTNGSNVIVNNGMDEEFVLVNAHHHHHRNQGSSSNGQATMTISQSMNSFGSQSSNSISSSGQQRSTTTPTTSPQTATQHINLSAIPNSMSVSGIDALAKLEELNMQAFTSLPPVPATSPAAGVKVSPGETVKSVIERTVQAEIEKQQQTTTATTSPKASSTTSPRSSSVFSVLGRIFKSGSKSSDDKSKVITTFLFYNYKLKKIK